MSRQQRGDANVLLVIVQNDRLVTVTPDCIVLAKPDRREFRQNIKRNSNVEKFLRVNIEMSTSMGHHYTAGTRCKQ